MKGYTTIEVSILMPIIMIIILCLSSYFFISIYSTYRYFEGKQEIYAYESNLSSKMSIGYESENKLNVKVDRGVVYNDLYNEQNLIFDNGILRTSKQQEVHVRSLPIEKLYEIMVIVDLLNQLSGDTSE